MKRAFIGVVLMAIALVAPGCGPGCGPLRQVPPQRLALVPAAPGSYTIRVKPTVGEPIDTPVPPDGRIAFEVPVSGRSATVFCLGVPVSKTPPAEERRVILVLREGRVLRKLSASDIGKLPTDAEGYHVLPLTK